MENTTYDIPASWEEAIGITWHIIYSFVSKNLICILMIHVITKGGMGNQMFQYAFALHLQKANRIEKIYLNGVLHPFYPSNRKQCLHHFRLTSNTKCCNLIHGYWLILRYIFDTLRVCGLKKWIQLLKRKRISFLQEENKLINHGIYYVAKAYYIPEIKATKGIKHVNGFFQATGILNGIESELKDAFTIISAPSAENSQLLDEIKSCNAVCLHIRRGDYMLYPEFQICDKTYYQKAVNHILQSISNPVFFVFSTGHEDIAWIKENYHFNADIRYVDLDNPDYEEMRLMMHCKHFIISNSTFSWWAAVLSSAAGNKIVLAPKRWHKHSESDMCLPSWILV